MEVKIVNKSGNPCPTYATAGSAGVDLRASLSDDLYIHSGERLLVPTGLYIQLPEGYEAQVRPRSGLALNKGITVLNAPGTIDADYRGEIGIILINHSKDVLCIKNGDRIAQMVIAKCEQIEFKEVENLDETERGSGGFGHTGK